MVRKIHMLLHESLDTAMQQRLIVNNPTNGTTIPKNNYPAKQILNDEQLDRFMEVIKSDERWYDFFYTELTTGLRRGEICGLRWEDFDEQNGRLKIRRSVGRIKNGVLPVGEIKTETGMREILLPPNTVELLSKRKENAVGNWIFPNIYRPEEPLNPQSAYTHLKVLLKKAELPLIRFHDLRHPYVKYTTKNNCYNLMKFFVCTEPIRRTSAKGTQFQSCCRVKRKPALSASLQENLLACQRRSVRRLFYFAAEFLRIPQAPILLAPQPLL